MNVAVVAHRGDSVRFRENTIPAFASAVALGATRVELDVRTTADGRCVVLHDPTLLRLWGVPWSVRDLTAEEVAGLGYADVRIPLLADVLDLLDGSGTGVLIDGDDAADLQAAWEVVRAFRPRDLDVHWCGPVPAARRVRALDPDAQVHLNLEQTRLDHPLVAELSPTHVNVEGILLSHELAAEVHGEGLLLSAWTVDRPADLAAVLDLGVDAVTTNRPLALRALLDAPSTGPTGAAARTGATTAGAAAYEETSSREESVAVDLARWAADYIRETPVTSVSAKAHDADLVTPVDTAVEDRVRAVIGAEFPEHDVVGEERGGEQRTGRPTWWVDPVDGTTNLASGLPWSSFSLALADGEELRVAAVADPWRGEVTSAAAGRGARTDGLPVRVREGTSLAGGVVLLELAAHEPWPGIYDVIDALAADGATARVMGSGTLSVASVGTGRALGAVISDWNPVDHAAALLIALEAGAEVRDVTGRSTRWPRSGPFVVAAPEVAERLSSIVANALRANVPRGTV